MIAKIATDITSAFIKKLTTEPAHLVPMIGTFCLNYSFLGKAAICPTLGSLAVSTLSSYAPLAFLAAGPAGAVTAIFVTNLLISTIRYSWNFVGSNQSFYSTCSSILLTAVITTAAYCIINECAAQWLAQSFEGLPQAIENCGLAQYVANIPFISEIGQSLYSSKEAIVEGFVEYGGSSAFASGATECVVRPCSEAIAYLVC